MDVVPSSTCQTFLAIRGKWVRLYLGGWGTPFPNGFELTHCQSASSCLLAGRAARHRRKRVAAFISAAIMSIGSEPIAPIAAPDPHTHTDLACLDHWLPLPFARSSRFRNALLHLQNPGSATLWLVRFHFAPLHGWPWSCRAFLSPGCFPARRSPKVLSHRHRPASQRGLTNSPCFKSARAAR